MSKIIKYLRYLPDLPKTLIFNLKYFGLKGAIVMPVRVSRKVKFLNLKGTVELKGPFTRSSVELGYSDVRIVDKKYSRTLWDLRGKVVFGGRAKIGYGSKISVGSDAVLAFGNDFVITASSAVVCNRKVSFGDGCLLSWDILVIDDDFHKIVNADGTAVESRGEIIVGGKNWIGCRCTILKGTVTPDNCVIGAGSLLNRKYDEPGSLLAGVPAKKIKSVEGWEL